MKPHWVEFDRLYNIDKKITRVHWICYECPKICVVDLPAKKNIYHCLFPAVWGEK